MGKRRRTEIAKIADPAARLVTYSKRRKGLFNKASELSRLCGARMAVVVFSPAGKPCSFGDPSAEEIIAAYLPDDDVMPPMGLAGWAEWVETEWAACTTEEDLESLILKYEAVRDCAREKLKALEGDSQVKMGPGDAHILSEEEIDSLFESLNGQGPVLSALLASPENSAAGGGNLAVEPTSALEGHSQVKMGLGSRPILSEEEIDSLFESLNDQGSVLPALLASPDNSAAGGRNMAVEPTPAPSGLGDDGFDPDVFLNLFEDGDGFMYSPEDLAVGGGSSGVESTRSNVQRYGYQPNDFAALEELDVHL